MGKFVDQRMEPEDKVAQGKVEEEDSRVIELRSESTSMSLLSVSEGAEEGGEDGEGNQPFEGI